MCVFVCVFGSVYVKSVYVCVFDEMCVYVHTYWFDGTGHYMCVSIKPE